MKRKGETFTEFLVAVAVFGIIMAGLFEFMANQTGSLANLKVRDELMFYAQRYLNGDTSKVEGVDFKKDDKTLTVSKKGTSMTFTLEP